MKKFLLPSFLLFATNCWATFPTTPILDNFNRANSSTTLGSNWNISTNTYWGNDTLGISSGMVYDPTLTNGGGAFWNVSSFSGTLEAYVTLSTVGSSGNAAGVTFASGLGTYDGYFVAPGASNIHIDLYVISSNSSTLLTQFAQVTSNGDSIGFSRTSAGLMSVYYKSVSGGGWVLLGTYTDATYSCSYAGILVGDTTARLSNFGGGTQQPPLTVNGNLTVQGNLTIH